jgi:hypothetical protein
MWILGLTARFVIKAVASAQRIDLDEYLRELAANASGSALERAIA